MYWWLYGWRGEALRAESSRSRALRNHMWWMFFSLLYFYKFYKVFFPFPFSQGCLWWSDEMICVPKVFCRFHLGSWCQEWTGKPWTWDFPHSVRMWLWVHPDMKPDWGLVPHLVPGLVEPGSWTFRSDCEPDPDQHWLFFTTDYISFHTLTCVTSQVSAPSEGSASHSIIAEVCSHVWTCRVCFPRVHSSCGINMRTTCRSLHRAKVWRTPPGSERASPGTVLSLWSLSSPFSSSVSNRFGNKWQHLWQWSRRHRQQEHLHHACSTFNSISGCRGWSLSQLSSGKGVVSPDEAPAHSRTMLKTNKPFTLRDIKTHQSTFPRFSWTCGRKLENLETC